MAQLAIQTKIEAVIKAQGSADTASKAHGNKKVPLTNFPLLEIFLNHRVQMIWCVLRF